MRIDSKYYSFCEEIGIMKENYTHQSALNSIINAVKSKKQADPKFVEAVSKLTLSSPEVSVRSCFLYRYDIDVDYVVGGNIKSTRIVDFGKSGVPDSLHITEYKGQGEYTVLKDFSSVTYSLYNDNNLFTFDQMKGALTDVVGKKLPSNYTSFQSKKWSVSAYIVPTLVVIMKYNGKEYQMYYNLQNGYYHYKWADNPELIKKGKKAGRLSALIKFACFFFTAIGIIGALEGEITAGIVIPIGCLIAQIIVANKTKKSKYQFERFFLNNPEKPLFAAMKSIIPMAIITTIAFIAGMVV